MEPHQQAPGAMTSTNTDTVLVVTSTTTATTQDHSSLGDAPLANAPHPPPPTAVAEHCEEPQHSAPAPPPPPPPPPPAPPRHQRGANEEHEEAAAASRQTIVVPLRRVPGGGPRSVSVVVPALPPPLARAPITPPSPPGSPSPSPSSSSQSSPQSQSSCSSSVATAAAALSSMGVHGPSPVLPPPLSPPPQQQPARARAPVVGEGMPRPPHQPQPQPQRRGPPRRRGLDDDDDDGDGEEILADINYINDTGKHRRGRPGLASPYFDGTGMQKGLMGHHSTGGWGSGELSGAFTAAQLSEVLSGCSGGGGGGGGGGGDREQIRGRRGEMLRMSSGEKVAVGDDRSGGEEDEEEEEGETTEEEGGDRDIDSNYYHRRMGIRDRRVARHFQNRGHNGTMGHPGATNKRRRIDSPYRSRAQSDELEYDCDPSSLSDAMPPSLSPELGGGLLPTPPASERLYPTSASIEFWRSENRAQFRGAALDEFLMGLMHDSTGCVVVSDISGSSKTKIVQYTCSDALWGCFYSQVHIDKEPFCLTSLCKDLMGQKLTVSDLQNVLRGLISKPCDTLFSKLLLERGNTVKISSEPFQSLVEHLHSTNSSMVVHFVHGEVLWTPAILHCARQLFKEDSSHLLCTQELFSSFIFPVFYLTLEELCARQQEKYGKVPVKFVFSTTAPLMGAVADLLYSQLPSHLGTQRLTMHHDLLCYATEGEITKVVQGLFPANCTSNEVRESQSWCLDFLKGPVCLIAKFASDPATRGSSSKIFELLQTICTAQTNKIHKKLQGWLAHESSKLRQSELPSFNTAAQQIALFSLLPESFGAIHCKESAIHPENIAQYTQFCRVLALPLPDYWDIFALAGLLRFSRVPVATSTSSTTVLPDGECSSQILPPNYGIAWELHSAQEIVVHRSLPQDWITWNVVAFKQAARCFWRTPKRILCKVLAVELALVKSELPSILKSPVGDCQLEPCACTDFAEINDPAAANSPSTLYFVTGKNPVDVISWAKLSGQMVPVWWCTTKKRNPEDKCSLFANLDHRVRVFVSLNAFNSVESPPQQFFFQLMGPLSIFTINTELFCNPIREPGVPPPALTWFMTNPMIPPAPEIPLHVPVCELSEGTARPTVRAELGFIEVTNGTTMAQLCRKFLLRFGNHFFPNLKEACFCLVSPKDPQFIQLITPSDYKLDVFSGLSRNGGAGCLTDRVLAVFPSAGHTCYFRRTQSGWMDARLIGVF
ncbi:hypothetical protein Pelo_6085 [Pelomyxa schiedti]|nr:hypothetical protein Pelo_6085 [Pelomyxa schiedti]